MIKGSVPESEIAPDVVQFTRMFGLLNPPTFLAYRDYGYEPNWCHVSAKHRAITDGGKRVHGWALWQFDGVIFADHHSVWEAPDGTLIDVTPPKYGADRVLFVRDDTATIDAEGGMYMLLTNRSSLPEHPFIWGGAPSEYTHWPCAPDKTDLVDYSNRLGIPVSAILTDDAHG